MKRIVILCDGTWSSSDATQPTNVMRLASAVSRVTSDKTTQQVIYVAGVGAGRGTTKLSRMIDRFGGGALGWGLENNILEAYWHLAFNYELGDEIFIFGFSRGAFTARSLAGLIRYCGIPAVENLADIPKAIHLYRARDGDTHPDGPAAQAFRAKFSPQVATSDADVRARLRKNTTSTLLRIPYLGVWDTVGALGIPQHFVLAKLFGSKYRFHDLALSSMVKSARHAVATDEMRSAFLPTVWDNLEDLNHVAANGDPQPYRQQWFPGDHGSAGGGGSVKGLSSLTLQWIVEGAQKMGLDLNAAMLDREYAHIDVNASLRSRVDQPAQANLLGRLVMGHANRPGPRHRYELSQAARTRMKDNPTYRPETLRSFFND